MALSQDHIEELKILLMFDLKSTMRGIKVHHDADPAAVAATKRLFNKGMLTRDDGGYLTDLGIETAEHAHHAIETLDAKGPNEA